jgi:hypothetical protein
MMSPAWVPSSSWYQMKWPSGQPASCELEPTMTASPIASTGSGRVTNQSTPTSVRAGSHPEAANGSM